MPKKNMMTKIYLAVRIYATIHLLHALWIFLFRRRMYGLWEKLYRRARIIRLWRWRWHKRLAAARLQRKKLHNARVKRKNGKTEKVPVLVCDVIGRTKTVYIPDPKKVQEPIRSEPLPDSGFIGEDEDISSDDVEEAIMDNDGTSPVLTASEMQDLMTPAESEPDPDFPSGIPIDRISAAADVLLSGSNDKDKRMLTAETLFQLKDTDLFRLFAENICPQEELDMIISECLTDKGERKNITDYETEKHQPVNWDEYM